MDNGILYNTDRSISTRQRIVNSAVDLFATKGYTETSVRDIATDVGINASSLYNHFKSKEDILLYLLKSFEEHTQYMYSNPEMPAILQNNPTPEGVLTCLQESFAILTEEFYIKALQVLFQEQHRNSIAQEYVKKTILASENYVLMIFNVLKNLRIISHDADPEFWKKIASSLLYTFPNRMMMGMGDDLTSNIGMGLKNIFYYMFTLVINIYGVSDSS
ncbi:MAG: TetR/AcrR family transcriptional regulator [Oscillospiraceae bacterium]|nr:TetR/AcrR family transcriptional regulator [Oscillospiraceae bacterium]